MSKKEILKNKSEKELKTMLSQKQGQLMDFRFKISKGKAKNVKEGKILRKEIARILTHLSKLEAETRR